MSYLSRISSISTYASIFLCDSCAAASRRPIGADQQVLVELILVSEMPSRLSRLKRNIFYQGCPPMTFLSQSSDSVYSCAHEDNSSRFSLFTLVLSSGASKTNTSFASKKSKNKGD